MEKYGLEWHGASEVTIELKCYREPEQYIAAGASLDPPFEHFRRALDLLFIKPYAHLPIKEKPLIWNDWTEEHAYIWCNEEFATVWGPAAASKSNDFGMFSVVDFWSAPKDTYIVVCSTTKAMLEKRIWESVKRYFALYKGRVPGKLSKSRTAIINDDDDDDDVKAGIHGIAILQGTVQEARSNIIGVHLPYVRLIVDEMQSTRRAAVEARANLSKGCEDFRFFGLANPESLFDLSGEYSEPVDGWDSISPDTHKWSTRWGMTYHYDGFKSPAVIEENGAEKYPFLINQKQIARQIQDSGDEDHPDVWTFVRGFPASQNEYDRVLSESFIKRFRMMDKVNWQYGYEIVAGLDPSFSSGGDKCILQPAKIGVDVEGNTVLEFMEPQEIIIKATHPDPPIYQVAHEVIRLSEVIGFRLDRLTVDETASQSTGAVIDRESGGEYLTHKIIFNSKATELPVSKDNGQNAKDAYKDKVTECWFGIREFGRYGQIRGLPLKAAKEFCMRKVERGHPVKLERKLDMKDRLKHSPDNADACACVIAQVREIQMIVPGVHKSIGFDQQGNIAETMMDTKSMKDMLAQSDVGTYENADLAKYAGSAYSEW